MTITLSRRAAVLGAATVLAVNGVALAAPASATKSTVPSVTGVNFNSGPLGGGTRVDVTGNNLNHATKVMFGRTAGRAIKVVNSGLLEVTSPKGRAGHVDVRVTTRSGTSAPSVKDRFTYLAVPTITRISATSGPPNGGTRVTVTGRNFSKITGVLFGGTKGRLLALTSPTSLQITAPRGAAGTVDVRVATRGGTSPVTTKDRFSYVAPPKTTVSTVVAPAYAPNGSAGNDFTSITDSACAPGGTCYAVGDYAYVGGDRPILETLSDGTWSESLLPMPTGAASPAEAELKSISCPTDDSCEAVGVFIDEQGYERPLTEQYLDGDWYAGAPLGTAGTLSGYWSSITCTDATSCAVTGFVEGQGVTLATLHDGTWQVVTAPVFRAAAAQPTSACSTSPALQPHLA